MTYGCLMHRHSKSKMFSALQLFLVLILATYVEKSKPVEIVPNSSRCHSNPECFTLDQLTQTNFLTNGINLSLYFQPGEHILTHQLNVHAITLVQMIGQNAPVISFHGESQIELSSIDQLDIEGLTFAGHTSDLEVPMHRVSIKGIQSLHVINCYFTSLDTRGFQNDTIQYGTVLNLRSTATATVGNVTFKGNYGTALSINNTLRNVTIENCTFIGNQGQNGGAVSIIDSVYTSITDSLFTSNRARDRGGAINILSGEVLISHCLFTQNSAIIGGGITVDSNNGSVSISNTEFSLNKGSYGAGIAVLSGSVSVFHSCFTKNTANLYGGGTYLHSGNVSVSYCNLVENNAGNYGGGINVNAGSLSISNSEFSSNSGGKDGGGVYVGSAGSIEIFQGKFMSNSAGINGGGIYVLLSISSAVSNSVLIGNYVNSYGAGIYAGLSARASIFNTVLAQNSAGFGGGGIYFSAPGSALVSNCVLKNNFAKFDGGGLFMDSGNLGVSNSNFIDNGANNSGGGIYVQLGSVSVVNSTWTDNNATFQGGAVVVDSASVSISDSILESNSANIGGGIYAGSSEVSIMNSELMDNTARVWGGGMALLSAQLTSITNSTFTANRASDKGGALYTAQSLYLLTVTSTNITNNTAREGSLYILQSTLTFAEENRVTMNNGSIYVFDSQVYLKGTAFIDSNYGGGGIELFQSELYHIDVSSRLTISNNSGIYGGGILLRESSLFVHAYIYISNNTANIGGAIYAYQSTIEFKGNPDGTQYMITSNHAFKSGGGIYATATVIKLFKSYVHLDSNTAEDNGGGLYLLQNSRVYIQRSQYDGRLVKLTLSNNKAQVGGGVYIDDSTASSSACRTGDEDFLGECFIQTIQSYNVDRSVFPIRSTVNTFITNNTARLGNAIYGGLLDRCNASQTAELANVSNGLEYIKRTVELPEGEQSISSDPLQVKLCNRDSNVFARKGQPFILKMRAIDQVGNPLKATIHGAVVTNSGIGRLKEGQVEQNVGSECTELEYNVFSEDSTAQVELYAKGPCKDLGISKLTLTVTFLECICPLGFHPSSSKIECRCECDQELPTTKCFSQEETFQLDTGLWIAAANFTQCTEAGYLFHECPFDYCVVELVNFTLNNSQEIDRQCAYNRTGVLCGECEQGLSLVLASSKCKECSNIFLLLLIPFAAAGIALVVFILLLNITIATGTIHGLILYANILAANKAIFLPFIAPNFLTVFVSWINLDLGIETCFFDGMNSQAKVLLQMVFPVYLFLLIILIIILSRYIDLFAKLLSNRNPVASLCTLAILSYSKLLRLIIAALQLAFLDCPDGSYKIVWLYDANVRYFSPSHIPRFVAAATILTACVLFTTLLFFGQWFPRCSEWKIMKWTRNTKYNGFMDAFHAPFTPKHRYWLGLLLFALIAHNLAASMALNTSVPVLSAGCVALGLIVYSKSVKKVYKSWLNNLLETFYLMNVVTLALGTYHLRNDIKGQLVLANISMAAAFILFVVIMCYHFYKYVLKKTNKRVPPLRPIRRTFNFSKNRNYQKLRNEKDDEQDDDTELPAVADMYTNELPREENDPDKYITPPIIRPATRPDQLREPDLDILAPVTEDDYIQGPPIPENRPKAICTTTVVEIMNP